MAVRRELSSFPLHRLPRPAAEVSSGIGRTGCAGALAPGSQGRRNNDSCVVQLDDGRHRLLLSGDIEQQAERRLPAGAGGGRGAGQHPAGEPASWQSHLLHGPSWRR